MELAERIRRCAEVAGSGDALSRKTGIPRNTLESYLTGKSEPKASRLAAIAKATGVSLDWLVAGDGLMFNILADSAVSPVAATQVAAPQVDAGQVGRILEAISKVYKEFGYNLTLAQLGVKATEIASDLAADVPPDASLDAKLAAVQTAAAMLRRQLREAAQNPTGEAASKQRA